MANSNHSLNNSARNVAPSVEPEVALLLTNEDNLGHKAISLLLKISSSIVQQPNEKRVRSLNLSSRAVEFTLLPAIGAIELLFFMGFQEANDRLIMPDDACLETVKMYQEQLKQLLSYKISSHNNQIISECSALSLHTASQSSNNSSPASLRSNPTTATDNKKAKDSSKSPIKKTIGQDSQRKSPSLANKSVDPLKVSESSNQNSSSSKSKDTNSSIKNIASLISSRKSPIMNKKTKNSKSEPSKPVPQSDSAINKQFSDNLKKALNANPATALSPVNNSSSSSQSASTVSDVSGSCSSSTPSSIVATLPGNAGQSSSSPGIPVHSSTGATNKKSSPYKLRGSTNWLNRFSGYLQRVLSYEDNVYQNKARSLIPIPKLNSLALQRLKEMTLHQQQESKEKPGEAKEKSKPNKPFDFNDHLLVELMLWFKHEFFRWFDCGWCEGCRCNMASKGTVQPTKYELEGEANNVEYYQCQTCHKDFRFPRYLNVGRLLDTRQGRCGEWASCFTLCCRALGFDSRQVFDETDHTWTEVWSQSQSKWLHVDPCEARLDCPLLYECGWGKALSYVVACSRDEVMDVTWRYTLQPMEVKKRRDKVSEEQLWQHLWSLTVQLQQQHQHNTRHQLHLRMVKEMAGFFAPRKTPGKEELDGRTSGSLGWRMSRGETGLLQTSSHHTFALHHTARITTLTVKYNPVKDVYSCDGVVGPSELQGWRAGVYKASNIAFKRESDWHNVYLARTEGEVATRKGEMVWRVRWEQARVSLTSFRVVLRHTLYSNAKVTWGVTVGDRYYAGDVSGELVVKEVEQKHSKNINANSPSFAKAPSQSKSDNSNGKEKAPSRSKPDNSKVLGKDGGGKVPHGDKDNNCYQSAGGELVLRAVLDGGQGDCAWQHAQLFRLPDNDSESWPLLIELQFK